MDDETRKVLDGLTAAEEWLRKQGPIVLTDEYLRLIERVEQLPENRPGTDKTWTERCLDSWRREVKAAREIPRG